MKTLAILILLILAAASAQTKTKSFTDLNKWKMVWSDEFNYKGMPDNKKWSFEEGFIRGEELQYYTNGRKENVRVGGGVLTIEARKERTKNPRYDASSTYWQTSREYGEYTSGDITTQGKHSWTYGRIEVRAKLPRGNGVWPAIWTLGSNIPTASWPGCGEIDIMEHLGKEPNRIYITSHYAVDGKHQSNGNNFECPKPSADFHVYAIEWFPDRIDFFLDSTKYHTFAIDAAGKGDDNPFRKPHFILLNLALGGWGGPVDESILPQKYLIDYVRVYEQKVK